MHEDTVVAFRQPGSFSDDPLTDVLRAGARQLLGQAIEAEVEAHIAAHADLTDAKAGVALCVTDICLNARYKPGSARFWSKRHGCVTVIRR